MRCVINCLYISDFAQLYFVVLIDFFMGKLECLLQILFVTKDVMIIFTIDMFVLLFLG